MDNLTNIIIALITVCIPSLTTLLTSHSNKKRIEMYNAKQSIFQMIIEDKIRIIEGNIPENYQIILNEYDTYNKKGGNSYVHEKVEDYIKWYKEQKKR